MNYYIFRYNGKDLFDCIKCRNLYGRFKPVINSEFSCPSNNLEHMVKSHTFFEKHIKTNKIKSIDFTPCFATYIMSDLIYKLIL